MQRIITRLRYPKLILLVISIFTGFLVYFDKNNFNFHEIIHTAGYLGIFIAGALLAHGFTMGPGIAALLIISKSEPLLATSLIATIGTVVGNGIAYNLLRVSYHRELAELSKVPFFMKLQEWAHENTPEFVRIYILPVFAGIISATPLPDEFSVILVKASKEISIVAFTLITALVSIFGVTAILLIGKFL